MTREEAYNQYESEVALFEQYGSHNVISFEEWLEIKKVSIEPKEVPSELEEAAEKAVNDVMYDIIWAVGASNWNKELDSSVRSVIKNLFIAGAKWQAEKDKEIIELAEDHAMLAGMNKMKEEMMEKAVKGEVVQDLQGVNRVKSFGKVPEWLHFGDKVKIIIVKEDEK